MGIKRSTPSAFAALGIAAIAAAASNCGSGEAGFAPATDAGAEGYPSFGTSSPTTWSMPFGGSAVTPNAVSAAADGTVRIAGTLSGLATLGPVTLNSAGGSDVLVAKLDGSGHVLWARNFGDEQNQSAAAATVDSGGNVIVVGTFAGSINFATNTPVIYAASFSPPRSIALPTNVTPGIAALRALGSSDAFVAKLDPNGEVVWNTQFGGLGATTQALSVAVGSNDDIAVTGAYQGTTSFGNGSKTSVGGTDAYVVVLDDRGNTRWALAFGEKGTDKGTSVAVNPRGEVLATGNYESSINLGTGDLQGFGGLDVFLAKLSSSGTTEWSKGFGGPIDDDAIAVTYDPNGNAISLGNYAGDVDLGTGPLPSYSLPGAPLGWDVYLAKYDAAGTPAWVHHYGSGDPADRGDALATDASGDVYVAGHVRAPFVFGSCPITPANAIFGNAFLGLVTSTGSTECANEYGYGPTTQIRALALPDMQGIAMAGDFLGGVTFGQSPLLATTTTGFAAREEPPSATTR